MNNKFRVGDWVRRKPLDRGFPWGESCKMGKRQLDTLVKVREVLGTDLVFQEVNGKWHSRLFDLAAPAKPFREEDYL